MALINFQVFSLDELISIQQDLEKKFMYMIRNIKQRMNLLKHCNVVEGQIKNILRVIFCIQDHFPISYLNGIVHEINRLAILTNLFRLKEYEMSRPGRLKMESLHSIEKKMSAKESFHLDNQNSIYKDLKLIADNIPSFVISTHLEEIEIPIPKVKTFGFNESSWLICPFGHVYHKNEIKESSSDEYIMSDFNCIECFRTEKTKDELIGCPSAFL